MKKDKNFWDKYGYMARSKNRVLVAKALEYPQSPSELRKKTDLSMNLTSRALRELNQAGFAKCTNPKQKMGRIYQLTELGKAVREELLKRK